LITNHRVDREITSNNKSTTSGLIEKNKRHNKNKIKSRKMSFTYCMAKMQTLTVSDIFAQLIAEDDAPATIQLLCVLRKLKAADISQTIASMVNGEANADGEQVNVESVVLVAAAKHGSPNIVEAVLTDGNSELASLIIHKAKIEAQKNNHAAIVERLAQSAAGVGMFNCTFGPTALHTLNNNSQSTMAP
jgi:hypothetical protein